jgi:hypothetical protein
MALLAGRIRASGGCGEAIEYMAKHRDNIMSNKRISSWWFFPLWSGDVNMIPASQDYLLKSVNAYFP